MSEQLPMAVSVEEVSGLIQSGEPMILLDCRTVEEHALVHLEGDLLIPMDRIDQELETLQPLKDKRIVVYCHMGVRSQMVCEWLRRQGFETAQTMVGGIDHWAVKIDTSLPRY